MFVLDPVKELSKFRPLGFIPFVAVLVLTDKLAFADVKIESVSVIPAAKHSFRVYLHDESSVPAGRQSPGRFA